MPYYPRAGRTYLDTVERNNRERREADRRHAAEHADVILACRTYTCPADPRFTHLLNNHLICARCGNDAATILERTHA